MVTSTAPLTVTTGGETIAQSSYSGIAMEYVCSVLDPYSYAIRIPETVKSSLATRTVNYTITTNPSGNAIFLINPVAACNSAAALP